MSVEKKHPDSGDAVRAGFILLLTGGADTGNIILELREMVDTDDNVLKEAALASIVSKFGKLSLRIRDSVCACSFSVSYSEREMMDRPHATNRKRGARKQKFNPSTPWNSSIRYRHGRANNIAREQIFRYFDHHATNQKVGREN